MYEEIKAEIERMRDDRPFGSTDRWDFGRESACKDILAFIKSRQQPSEDLEKELDFQHFAEQMSEVFALPASLTKNTEENPLNWEYEIAKHFYELGKREQKEQMIPVTALVNESKDFLSLSLSTEEYAKIGRRFKGGDDIEIYIKRDKKLKK